MSSVLFRANTGGLHTAALLPMRSSRRRNALLMAPTRDKEQRATIEIPGLEGGGTERNEGDPAKRDDAPEAGVTRPMATFALHR
jgi:hypothetical protein